MAAIAPDALILQPPPNLLTEHWTVTVNRADWRLGAMYERHYSCYQYADKRTRKQWIAPGAYVAVMTTALDALFVWQVSKYRRDKQIGVNCAVFRNENESVSSILLIKEAMVIAEQKWGSRRLFTFVDPLQVKSTNPGFCFKEAGWFDCGSTASELLIFDYLPNTHPDWEKWMLANARKNRRHKNRQRRLDVAA